MERAMREAREYNVKQNIVAGGVSANNGLRKGVEEAVVEDGHTKLTGPPLSLCTYNAAMVGAAGTMAYLKGHRSGMDMNGLSGMELTSL